MCVLKYSEKELKLRFAGRSLKQLNYILNEIKHIAFIIDEFPEVEGIGADNFRNSLNFLRMLLNDVEGGW